MFIEICSTLLNDAKIGIWAKDVFGVFTPAFSFEVVPEILKYPWSFFPFKARYAKDLVALPQNSPPAISSFEFFKS